MTHVWMQWLKSKLRVGKSPVPRGPMVTCRQVIELLSDYINHELSPEDKTELDKHMQGCQNCETFLYTLSQSVDLLRDLRVEDIPDDVSSRLRNFLRSKYQSEK
ncbi:MAG: zf-HC2 domain-containing protein [Acidobacteria bacterium]|nr:zf-HC2 domain-containing protein [Acidobacteriota bacterium]MBI3656654.1 zf-HC2 domain-containing protein [Acidobacteriota bacterium]